MEVLSHLALGFGHVFTPLNFLVLLVGWRSVLWFQGGLVPTARDEMRQNQQKAAGPASPPP